MTPTGAERGEEASAGVDGFVWCADETLVDSDSRFEWDPPLESESTERRSEAETIGSLTRTPGRLDPSLVTTRRVPGRDDDAVARLTMLRRDPTSGQWRQVEAELVETD